MKKRQLKRAAQTAILLILIILVIGCSEQPKNQIDGVEISQIQLSHWGILGPFKDTLRDISMLDSIKQAALRDNIGPDSLNPIGDNGEQKIRYVVYNQKKERGVVDLGELFKTVNSGVAYAVCEVVSSNDQDVSFFIQADDGMRLWVNDKQVLLLDFSLGKSKKIRLRKGSNKFVAEVKSMSLPWFFGITATPHQKRNIYNVQFYLRAQRAIIPLGDSLAFKVTNSNYVMPKKTSRIEVYDIENKLRHTSEINLSMNEKLGLSFLTKGAYRYKLYTDRDTFADYFSYGNITDLYNKNKLVANYNNDYVAFNALAPYINRLDTVLKAYKKDPSALYTSKVSYCLYRINEIINARKKKVKEFSTTAGLTLRKFPSSIDNGDDYYMLYVPEKLKESNKPAPLIIMVPFITYGHPFYSGAIVANTERVTYMSRFAEKYGIAVLWPSARINIEYNQTPIVTKAILETLQDAGKYLNIDKQHMFLYGDCSGGLFAFQTAIRRPDLFAAIAVEGPEMTSVNYKDPIKSAFLSSSIFDLTNNFYGKPIFILHSRYDEKAPVSLSYRLMDSIKKNGGRVYFDNLDNAAKYGDVKLYSEADNMRKIFEFYSKQKFSKPNPIKRFTTYAIYNDTIYGVLVKEKMAKGKATVSYQLKEGRLELITTNVRKLAMDLKKAGLDQEKIVGIYLNGNVYRAWTDNGHKRKSFVEVEVGDANKIAKALVTKEFYGPINKAFLKAFAVVRPFNPGEKEKSIISTLDSLWLSEYRRPIKIIDESQVNNPKNKALNLIHVIGDINKIKIPELKNLEIKTNGDKVFVKGKAIANSALSFAFYHRGKENTDNIYLGTNALDISPEMLNSVILRNGWYDYEMWQGEYVLIQGSYASEIKPTAHTLQANLR